MPEKAFAASSSINGVAAKPGGWVSGGPNQTEGVRMSNLAEFESPFAAFLGIKITHVSPERVEAELDVRKELATIPDILHGGAVMALADNLGGVGTFVNLPKGARTATIESKT